MSVMRIMGGRVRKILIADDHSLFREGLRYLLDTIDDDLTVFEAETYPAALQIVSEKDVDLVLADLGMPGMERFAGLSTLIRQMGDTPVVVISGSELEDDMRHAMDCGAIGYIPKILNSDRIIEALKHILRGGTYIPPEIAGWKPGEKQPEASENDPHLTPRQRDVLCLMAEGKSNKEIARTLGLAEGTVKLHVTGLLKVLDVNNRTQAVVKAASMGLAQGTATG